MKLCHKFKSPQVAIECFQTLDEVESAINSPMDDHSRYSPPIVESAVNVATGNSSPVTIKSSVNVHYLSYSPLSIERSTQSSEESLKSKNSDIETDPSTCNLLNVLWAGDIYAYNVPSFSVLTVTLRHVVISFMDQRGYQKVDAFMQENPDILTYVPTSVEVTRACKVEVSCYVFISHVPMQAFLCFIFIRVQGIAQERGFIKVGHYLPLTPVYTAHL